MVWGWGKGDRCAKFWRRGGEGGLKYKKLTSTYLFLRISVDGVHWLTQGDSCFCFQTRCSHLHLSHCIFHTKIERRNWLHTYSFCLSRFLCQVSHTKVAVSWISFRCAIINIGCPLIIHNRCDFQSMYKVPQINK